MIHHDVSNRYGYDDNSCDDYYAILKTMGITLKMYKPQVYCDWW